MNTVWKALGGPILINSAVIITLSKSKTRKTKWPALWKIMSYRSQKVGWIVLQHVKVWLQF